MFQDEARAMYLMEKYGHCWRQKSLRGIMPLKLTDAAWLKQVLFNPTSRLARQVACNMLESLCQVPVRKREVNVMMAVIIIIIMLGTLSSIWW
jgi:E3 ubiquitin-protein ligase UBR4